MNIRYFLMIIILAFSSGVLLHAQSDDPLVSSCVLKAGSNTKYLKDFKIQLGQRTNNAEEMRYKTQISLWKNTKYRFSMCNDDHFEGQLILTIKDDSGKEIFSSFDSSGKIYPYIEFICSKSGIYRLNYDFYDGKQGLGVGVVSMVR